MTQSVLKWTGPGSGWGFSCEYDHVAGRPAVVHSFGNVFPNSGWNFRPLFGKSFPVCWRWRMRHLRNTWAG